MPTIIETLRQKGINVPADTIKAAIGANLKDDQIIALCQNTYNDPRTFFLLAPLLEEAKEIFTAHEIVAHISEISASAGRNAAGVFNNAVPFLKSAKNFFSGEQTADLFKKLINKRLIDRDYIWLQTDLYAARIVIDRNKEFLDPEHAFELFSAIIVAPSTRCAELFLFLAEAIKGLRWCNYSSEDDDEQQKINRDDLTPDKLFELYRNAQKESSCHGSSGANHTKPHSSPSNIGRYLAVLGLPADTKDETTVKHAFKKLAKEYHPDRGGDAEKFKAVSGARKKIYDYFGWDK
ncbi:MAG: DnaJ domain-containing protein [Candidatus Margulisbacteria bacterium]|nr:DnaJ domain-containing protein [Candidatus Margulisiibacteriota bacterium]